MSQQTKREPGMVLVGLSLVLTVVAVLALIIFQPSSPAVDSSAAPPPPIESRVIDAGDGIKCVVLERDGEILRVECLR